jgi:hypothetical protein
MNSEKLTIRHCSLRGGNVGIYVPCAGDSYSLPENFICPNAYSTSPERVCCKMEKDVDCQTYRLMVEQLSIIQKPKRDSSSR